MTTNQPKSKVYDLVLISLFCALMAICSWISIPAAVPFSLQTLGVFLTLGLLKGRRGIITILIYLLLGANGLPVFSGFSGGIGYMLGPTGGYIIGFLFTAIVMAFIEKILGRSNRVFIFSMIVGLIVCYAFGTMWFMHVYSKDSGPIALTSALSMCVFPYLIPDAIKIAASFMIYKKLKHFNI